MVSARRGPGRRAGPRAGAPGSRAPAFPPRPGAGARAAGPAGRTPSSRGGPGRLTCSRPRTCAEPSPRPGGPGGGRSPAAEAVPGAGRAGPACDGRARGPGRGTSCRPRGWIRCLCLRVEPRDARLRPPRPRDCVRAELEHPGPSGGADCSVLWVKRLVQRRVRCPAVLAQFCLGRPPAAGLGLGSLGREGRQPPAPTGSAGWGPVLQARVPAAAGRLTADR